MTIGKRTAHAVIGAGYGDEGKGLMTDWLASQGADVVVRSNGGAQAGHTVVTPEGERHVFHHLASGALAGVPTHLSSFFVAHPMLFFRERENLLNKSANVAVSSDPRVLVTTPWDMMLNQFIESRRGDARHGSCGLGFGETIERSLRPAYRITVGDLENASSVRDVLARVRSDWVADRLAALGGGALSDEETALVMDDGIFERFVSDCEAFVSTVVVLPDTRLYGNVLFEGAQGLMLDQDYGAFPHVTRSNTGLLNMAAVAREADIDRIEVTYVTRAYVTRHGAGPLGREKEGMEFARIVDPTNVPNDWQGSIRAAPLDTDVLAAAVAHDAARGGDVDISAGFAVTCLDQIVGDAVAYEGGARVEVSADTLPDLISDAIGLPCRATSWGPSRADVERYIPNSRFAAA